MSEFTKGKWEVQNWTEKLDGEFLPEFAVCVGDEWIADCADNEANARLIAAAPDMYHMIAYLLGYVREWEAVSWTIYKAKVRSDIQKAEALLARIDGEEADN